MSQALLKVKGVIFGAINAHIKNNDALDLSIVSLTKGSATAAVFTQNVFCAAPVLVAKNHLQQSPLAFLINSGNANAGTGVQGLENTLNTCELLANELNIKTEQVLPFSTGVIGQQLDLSKFEVGIPSVAAQLSEDAMDKVAKGILTTDLLEKTHSKTFDVAGQTVTISGIAKGSGMIRPNMATMLSFVFTDIKATQNQLQACLTQATNQSFNRITVDGDTSTNDACTLSATGASDVNLADCKEEFQSALYEVTKSLAHQIIKDGEGATKFVEIRVKGGSSNEDCLEVAYTVAHSPLVKTALFASDANWGRILAAVGRANIKQLNIEDINIYLNQVSIVKLGEPDPAYTEALGSAQMQKTDIVITIEIGNSNIQESVWTTDFSYDYIKINAEYRT
ncbi:bifunctional glutamate N-acetyltransferase/amino-acid acetyltransferase ArgJ [Candidatus Thioglobus sp.]|nr:bifunctional glutamate N-acetyltransferase/amino-acid acetyltransferase ArgJ [Candidatus Thioglobus sp.]MDB3893832.1 bifunctional glutamate N-acetyltransferase/amino-acid acetyltransferase ArgJ [Candidatus Thioglobus sp.]MDC0388860.1 bifunctional glutamate N-acetyltransferase/amino-acid acetyltransferase ArgJ [Candidatus Thioglobus sp.]MDC0888528.1 bifunctional glutamate N-acetyltransferase/amino-acid acetyltransferase ArgJ [Candidatus Thioglobus sp.]MDC0904772.1 bifunctional glutamate N-ace